MNPYLNALLFESKPLNLFSYNFSDRLMNILVQRMLIKRSPMIFSSLSLFINWPLRASSDEKLIKIRSIGKIHFCAIRLVCKLFTAGVAMALNIVCRYSAHCAQGVCVEVYSVNVILSRSQNR